MLLLLVFLNSGQANTQTKTERGCVMSNSTEEICGAISIAEYIIEFCNKQSIPVAISNIKLQKLLYLAYGNYYLNHGEVLFKEHFQAWQYGPVVESVYNQFCIYGGSYICLTGKPPALPVDVAKDIDSTIEKNMNRDVFDLVNETHQIGGAWDKAVKRTSGYKNHPNILLEDIVEEFRKRRNEDRSST